MKRKAKKSNISISRTTLYTQEKIIFACKIFFFKNVCSRTKNNLQLRKKTQIKFLSSQSKEIASHTFSLYGNCMISNF